MRPRKEATISQYIEFVPDLIPSPHSQTSFPTAGQVLELELQEVGKSKLAI